jgi:hypothetical protein
MSKFHVKEACELPGRPIFVLTGSVVEGEVQPGMWVNVPAGEYMTLRAPILNVETMARPDREDVCVHVQSKLGVTLREDGIEIRGQTIEITRTRIKSKETFNLHDPYELRAIAVQEFKCIECGWVRTPEPGPDESYAEAMGRLAQEVRASGWYVPEAELDCCDMVTCYCPACAKKRAEDMVQIDASKKP